MQSTRVERIVSARYLSRIIVNADDPEKRFEQLVRLGGVLYGLAGILAVLAAMLLGNVVRSSEVLITVGIVCMTFSLIALGLPDRIPPWLLLYGAFIGVITTSFAVAAAGRTFGALGTHIYVWIAAYGLCVFRRRVGIALTAAVAIGFAFVLAGFRYPLDDAINLWLWIVVTVSVTATIVGWAFHYANDRTAAEHQAREELARANEELSTFSARLGEQVDEQMQQLERMSQLRRFLSPAVADALLGASSEEIFRPHRREISVVFIDLRGFTAFSGKAEPEEIVAVLKEYFDQLGQFVNRFGATVGTFSGDGVMLYLNDPVPCPEPAATAVEMSLEIRQALLDTARVWRQRGFDLSFGIGIAFGYATLGVIGFAGREDYTAVGTVVNLSARLCEVAAGGQILIDPKTRAAVDWISVEELEPISVKGFADSVVPFSVVARSPRHLEAVPDVNPAIAREETA